MKQKGIIIVVVVVAILVAGVVVYLSKKQEPSPPTSVTATPTVPVDTELFWTIYTDFFPKDSVVAVMDTNSRESFEARIEITEKEWKQIKAGWTGQKWMSQDISLMSGVSGSAEKLFTEEERNAFSESWVNLRYVLIPSKRGVEEHVQIMQWKDGKILVFYCAIVLP
ncbi:MAG: hypothetical protein K6E71_02450 [Lachnospiraceae bacterium]|nr:hypothetical protein [Lachnospiraceae bacterium]